MYISTAAPDPQYLTPNFTCEQIPTEENNFQGQNTVGWCNEEASAMLDDADRRDRRGRAEELVKTPSRSMETDYVLLPLVNYPKSGLWRTDKARRTGGRRHGQLPGVRQLPRRGRTSTVTARSSSVPSSGRVASTR